MSKRRLEGDIDKLSREVLGDLSSNDRLELLLGVSARGKKAWADRIVKACPTENYVATDLQFIERVRLAGSFAQAAVYELHTSYLYYDRLRIETKDARVLEFYRKEALSDEYFEERARRNKEMREWFADLYALYHANRRFATEVLGVDLRTWLANHEDGPKVLEIVADTVDNEREIELTEAVLNQECSEGEGENETAKLTLDEVADRQYEEIVMRWEELVAKIP
jgi:hypothetical protein